MPREISHWDWLVSVRVEGDRSYISGTGYGWDQTIWRQLIGGQDQLCASASVWRCSTS